MPKRDDVNDRMQPEALMLNGSITMVHAARIGKGALAATALCVVLGSSGCAPRLIQDYAVKTPGAQRCVSQEPGKLVFAVQEGTAYGLGECDRAPTGELTNCKTYEVEFE